ncbi:tellurite resistance TerB family protein [Avibacterium gallinarum]|uniref:tellurite resistance TerB family protein n=1 Tax=Avibacterium gallinarum TaxID=755 RepID=UPI003BF8E79A
MDFNQILNQVFNVAKDQFGKTMNGNSTADKITKVGGGAAAIGLLSMIFGRNGGASLTKLGSLAALGSLAYQAYQQYQQKNSTALDSTLSEETFVDTAEKATSGQLILQTMIAAAAADGAITDEEKQLIITEAGNDPEVYHWLQQQIEQPISIAQIAQQVGNDTALASQVYLAARVVCGELDRKEIVFLANLATALNLDDALVEQLEKQAGF